MIILRNALICIIICCAYTFLSAQTTTILNTPDSGRKEYVASQEIALQPNYKFKAGSDDFMWGYIDDRLPGQTTYEDLYTESAFNNRTIDEDLDVGFTPGEHGVSTTGGATYNLPIQIPSGTNGFVPSLSVNYNSQAGNGLLGMGWNLSATSMISRVGKTIYHNGKAEAVQMDNTDIFVMDGQRFFPLSGINGGNNTDYGFENENYSKVTSYGQSGNGPEWFKVQTKNGITMEFGNTFRSTLPESGNTILMWGLNKMYDQYGNYIEYIYKTDNYQLRLHEIRYTGNSEEGIAPYNKIKFYYDERDDKNFAFIGNNKIQFNYLLSKIEIETEGSTFKTYDFDYGLNLLSYLKKVTESGANGGSLNSTIFNYGSSGTEYDFIQSSNIGDKILVPGDYNGDGKSDLLALSRDASNTKLTKAEIYKNTDGSLNSIAYTHNYNNNSVAVENWWGKKVGSLNTRAPSFFTDFTGDNLDDLLIAELNPTTSSGNNFDVGLLKIAKANSSNGFTDFPLINTNDGRFKATSKRPIILLDYNGDKAVDVVTFPFYDDEYHTFTYQPSTGSFHPTSMISNHLTAEYILDADNVVVADIDGDGKQELIVIDGDNVNSSTMIYHFDYVPGGSGAVEINLVLQSGIFNKWHDLYPGDFNGDQKTDFLYTGDGVNWSIAYSTGTGFDAKSITFDQVPFPYFNGEAIEIADYNGDGLTDIFFPHSQNLSIYSKSSFYLSKGNNIFVKKEFTNSFSSSQKIYFSSQTLSADFNGDGRANLLHLQDKDLGGNTFPIDVISLNSNGEDLRLSEIKDGFNKRSKFEYASLVDNTIYTKGSINSIGIVNVQPALYAVKKVGFSNGIGSLNFIEYKYGEAIMDRIGQGVFGFLKLTKIDLANNRREEETRKLYSQNLKYSILPFASEQYRHSHDELLVLTQTNYQISRISGKRFKTELINSNEENALMGWNSTRDFEYDDFGNIVTSISDNGVETEITEEIYDISTGSWISYLPSSISVTKTRSGQQPYTRVESFLYNSKGKIAKKTIDSGKPKALSVSYSYDNFGNVVSSTESANGLPNKVLAFEYNNKGRFLTQSINAFGQSSHFTFHKIWGTATKEVDIRGKITTNKYNEFGKHIKTTSSAGISTAFSYEWDFGNFANDPTKLIQFNSSIYKINQTTSNSYAGTVWYDRLKREVKVSKEHQSGTDVVNFINYDEKGNKIKVSEPEYANSINLNISSLFYDKYNRSIRREHPAGNIYTYYQIIGDLFETKSIKSGITKKKTIDISGKVVSASDNGGTLEYVYNSAGQTIKVLSDGTIITEMEYDEYNRQIKLFDVNAGWNEYVYNAYGQVISEKDALGNIRSYSYDNHGRINLETGSEGSTSYTYVSSGNGLNQIKKVIAPNNSFYEYFYDSYGRNTKLNESIDGVIYSTSFTYNNSGQKTSITYPSNYKVNYSYNNKSELDKITDQNGKTLLSNVVFDEKGNYIQYDLGNNLTHTNEYDQYGLLLKSKAGAIFEMEYTYNIARENMTSRSDNINNLTETFTYDNLDRLSWNTVSSSSPTSTAYQKNGNLTHQTNFGMGVYDAVKLNQESEIIALQNQCRLNNQNVTYTAFDRTATVGEDGYELTLSYDAFKNRNKSTLKHLGVVQQTRYFLGTYEKTITGSSSQEVHYIACGNGVTILYVEENGSGNYFYPHTDHLGSILKVSDDYGTVVADQNFDAWGRYRNPTDWTYTNIPTTNPSWLYRGFTGHEMLPMFTLINMNNRMYDPEVGRFLAVDNYVNDPYSTQDYNRYAYANNNPLKFVDPNGESVIGIVAISLFAVGGAYLGGVSTNGGQLDPSMWNWKSGKTWAGIGIGAAAGFAAGYGMLAGGAALAETFAVGGYAATGAATGFAAGYIIGFTGTTISGGNLASSHKAGWRYGGTGFLFGSVVGGLAGVAMDIESILKTAPPRPQEVVFASLDNGYYNSSSKINWDDSSDGAKIAGITNEIRRARIGGSSHFYMSDVFYNLPEYGQGADIGATIRIGPNKVPVTMHYSGGNYAISTFPNSTPRVGSFRNTKVGGITKNGYWNNMRYRRYDGKNNPLLFIQIPTSSFDIYYNFLYGN